jgi:hypothetical protein
LDDLRNACGLISRLDESVPRYDGLQYSHFKPEHDYYKHPEWMIKYGGKYYYNPAFA